MNKNKNYMRNYMVNYMEIICSFKRLAYLCFELEQYLLSIHDIDTLLHLAESLTCEVVNVLAL